MGNSLCRIWGLRDRDAHGEGGTNRFRDLDASPYSSDKVHYMVREIDTKWWSIRTPSPVPFPLERGRGASKRIEYQPNRALRDRDAQSKGVQTSFVISMLHFGCCRRSIEYGPRDRHKMVIDPNSIPRPLPLGKGKGCFKEDGASTKPSIARSRST